MIKIFDSIEELNFFAAEKICEIAGASISSKSNFTIALAGGSTPKSLYKLLSGREFQDKINWKSVFFFFGDERNVPPDSEDSNFNMANEILLKPLKIDKDKIYRWETEFEKPEKVAEEYADSLEFFFRGFPTFDLILLGMGDDGHTASLFPMTEALKETEKIAVANWVPKLNTTRLTFTFPVINNARNVMFLVAGADKSETLQAVLQGGSQPDRFPAQNVKPINGNLFWLVDKAAARLLK